MDYQKGKIYVLRDIRTNDQPIIYVGSTTQSLSQRMSSHRSQSSSKPLPIYKYILDVVGGWDSVKIELYENYPCDSKDELNRREGEVIREFNGNGTLKNVYIAGRTQKQYYEETKEKFAEQRKQYREENKEYMKQYREENKEKIIGLMKQYYEANKEAILENRKQYCEANREMILERKKEYYEANKAAILETRKQYREANKEKLRERVKCGACNCEISKACLSKHNKTKKHLKNLTVQQ